MKRPILSLISALVLAAGLLFTTAAAAGPRLVTSQTAAPSQDVTLTGVSSDCQSLQITLNLSASGSAYTYEPDAGLNRNGIHTVSKQAGSQVTLYITAKSGVLAADGTLLLGTLTAADGTTFTVTGFSDLMMADSSSAELPGGGSGSADSGTSSGGSSGNSSGSQTGGSSDGSTNSGAEDPAPQPLPFADVADGTWYADAVRYVYQQGLMTGTSEDRFSPDVTTNRAMLVTILYRLEGSPTVTGTASFPDVAAGQWYTDAVIWASANGIVTGYDNGSFGPEDTITREQMATIFYRYNRYKGYDRTAQAALSGYADAGQVSSYAAEAMGWAIGTGLITGTSDTTLSPAGFATRAQAAVILTRFCQTMNP
ncbi:S-layer homology domain-containing protein [Intestinimonas massiliensis (ex Afouda et al. 2020)]|uniref:S-layer homology domain-containing protein n=1 Tax=Intestinimonas massiliensis (ex Afouda et al. 2020) TaxID=1673721 RepID=UPI001030C3BC|nr:S-layer homology domain-containing protein [Intestinimonas massiliensis (ex Afouda et al. 2020)]